MKNMAAQYMVSYCYTYISRDTQPNRDTNSTPELINVAHNSQVVLVVCHNFFINDYYHAGLINQQLQCFNRKLKADHE